MKNVSLIRPLALWVGVLLVAPSLYFVVSALLSYGFGILSLWKLIESIFDNAGNKSVGLNINILMLFGPIVAILINLPQVIHLHFSKDDDEMYVYLFMSKYKYSWLVIVAGAACLITLFFYLLAKNCTY